MSGSGLDVAAGEKRLEDVGGEGHDGGRGGGKMSRPYYDRRKQRENLGPDYHIRQGQCGRGCPRDAGAKVHGQHVRIDVDAQVFSDHRADMPGDAIDTHVFGKIFGAQAAGFFSRRGTTSSRSPWRSGVQVHGVPRNAWSQCFARISKRSHAPWKSP